MLAFQFLLGMKHALPT